MNMMIAITISPGAVTAAARLTAPWVVATRTPPPAATTTSRKVPKNSENSRRHSSAGVVEVDRSRELEPEQHSTTARLLRTGVAHLLAPAHRRRESSGPAWGGAARQVARIDSRLVAA